MIWTTINSYRPTVPSPAAFRSAFRIAIQPALFTSRIAQAEPGAVTETQRPCCINPETVCVFLDLAPPSACGPTPYANVEVAKVERLLNARPRKSLGFRSPQEVFDSLAHS